VADLILIGASGLAREVLATVRDSGQFDVVGILDDDAAMAGTTMDGSHILGPISHALNYPDAKAVICVGAGGTRAGIAASLAALGFPDRRYATVVDASVRLPEGCRVGHGNILLGHVTLTAGITIGNHVVVMPGVTLTHDDVVADFATFAAGVSLGGGVRIGRAAYLGMNSCVRERTTVGAAATIGMGAAVLADVPAGETWAGVPARVIERTMQTAAASGGGR
jgi:sugar O-acyltransferase (sialic acid O-acetyltransferase NeuD family)